MKQETLAAVVRGRVQGVFFRQFVLQHAGRLDLKGYVRNMPGGAVEVRAEGEREKLDKLLELLKTGPPYARVEEVKTTWFPFRGRYTVFEVLY